MQASPLPSRIRFCCSVFQWTRPAAFLAVRVLFIFGPGDDTSATGLTTPASFRTLIRTHVDAEDSFPMRIDRFQGPSSTPLLHVAQWWNLPNLHNPRQTISGFPVVCGFGTNTWEARRPLTPIAQARQFDSDDRTACLTILSMPVFLFCFTDELPQCLSPVAIAPENASFSLP